MRLDYEIVWNGSVAGPQRGLLCVPPEQLAIATEPERVWLPIAPRDLTVLRERIEQELTSWKTARHLMRRFNADRATVGAVLQRLGRHGQLESRRLPKTRQREKYCQVAYRLKPTATEQVA